MTLLIQFDTTSISKYNRIASNKYFLILLKIAINGNLEDIISAIYC